MGYKCGFETNSGTLCKRNVKILGEKCYRHNDSGIGTHCSGITKNGTICKSHSRTGFKYCPVHKKQDPDYLWFSCVGNTGNGKSCSNEADKEGKMCALHAKLAKREIITEKQCKNMQNN
uniref:Uncharacterized protein n=1 Tax=Pithovirus LCPAC403 TaxID=2506596 RepID=A0A481ZCN1_9VIRU|nr:MAG: uncharacterized protein LCPAC403_00240 [Pithovirus LCPAC403]